MSPLKAVFASALLAGAFVSGTAAAHGVRFGFNFGFPVFAPAWYYPPPAYYYSPPVVVAPSAQTYVERNDAQATPSADNWWYYCADSKTYYPYVKECASQWQRVSPRPPGT